MEPTLPELPEASQPANAPPDRERILATFARWLDRALAEEPQPELPAALLAALKDGEPPPSLDRPESGCDLYSLWSATTALAQEVRLQGRQFKLLSENLEAMTSRSEDGPENEVEPAPLQPQIDLLLELHERLERTVTTARAAAEDLAQWRPSWLSRRLGRADRAVGKARELAESLVAGGSLTLDRLEEALRESGVRPLHCLAQPFDPLTMSAIAVELTEAVPEGTVVEVFRNGYERNGAIYRAAQVKVARAGGEGKE
ncbi:MAG: nucleotide exchange factor GrpE [Acidobacteriota bacterium]